MRSIPYHNGKTVYISAGDKPPPYIPNVCQADISLLAQQGISRTTTLCISRMRQHTYHECKIASLLREVARAKRVTEGVKARQAALMNDE